MSTLAEHNIGIILLAAGRGTRMGAVGLPKMLLPMQDGRPIVWHAGAGALALEPLEMVVVVRPDLPEIASALAGLAARCVPNPRFMEGMGTSLAVGVAALSDTTQAVLVMLGDEPAVSLDIVKAIVEAHQREGKPITTPMYGTQPGPPILFARSLFTELTHLEGDTGGRQLIARYPHLVTQLPLPEQARPRDIDTPEDYGNVKRET